MKTSEIRSKFLNFFKKNGHTVVPSDSLIPTGDPSLLFTSAGMVQFKKHFLGQIKLDYTRAASCQKCLRTSDIERVGLTARHLTFFEMLGNFSFGDYFKKEAVAWGWEFLTKDIGLAEKKLYPSVYTEDSEAFDLWKKMGVPESRIVKLGADSNFWTMGPTGPCGPCSEILYDRGESYSQDHQCPGPGCDCDRYMEVWNLVFTQFDRSADGKLNPLPQKNIDTGMGLERLTVAANDLGSSFETDYFQDIIRDTKKLIGEETSVKSQRIISDHLRASTFMIGDGVLPSNEGRGYILRRLLRRALRQGWTHGKKEPFLNRIVPVVVADMKSQYPELGEREANIRSIIETEEKNALSTIESGTRMLEDEIRKATGKSVLKAPLGNIKLSGDKVFNIYDTYGLDKEIQREIVKDLKGELDFSEADYEKAKEKASETARKGWKGSGEKDLVFHSELSKKAGGNVFRGYEVLETKSKVMALAKESNGKMAEVSEMKAGDEGELVLAETPFYAESGGQVGDRGTISHPDKKFVVEVLDTQKPVDGLIVHEVRVKSGAVKSGDAVLAQVDETSRKHTMRHHTATHLLHAALRSVLGSQVTQAGSLVTPEKLRFDFTYPKALTDEQLDQIESHVNRGVLANVSRKRSEGSLDDARKEGALAFFGDKYGSKVFVVKYDGVSTEVCGGTHCLATGDIGSFKITSESSVGSGVRRIEAVAGEKALEYFRGQSDLIRKLSDKLRASPAEALDRIDKLLQKQLDLERELQSLRREGQSGKLSELVSKAKSVPIGAGNGSAKVLAEVVDGLDAASLRDAADALKDKLGSGVVLLATSEDDKVSFVVSVTPDCAKQGLHAGKIAKSFAQEIGGSGGGRDVFAQGGGKKSPELDKILGRFPETLGRK